VVGFVKKNRSFMFFTIGQLSPSIGAALAPPHLIVDVAVVLAEL
jgi:hypothetical protein